MTSRENQANQRAAKQFATLARAHFDALREQGFDAEQALRLVVAIFGSRA